MAIAGTDWSDDENDALVADYFSMLQEELAGRRYVKAIHRRAVVDRLGRNEGSVERKYMNVSAVLMRLGLPRIRGYAPNENAQFNALVGAIDRYLSAHPELTDVEMRAEITVAENPFVDPPSIREASRRAPEPISRFVGKFDPVARDARNRALGKKGEVFVLEVEERRLFARGRADLAKAVRWVSDLDGDGAGYDIRSFHSISGAPRFIEVKSTCGGSTMPFMLTRNEELTSKQFPDEFRLYRVFDLAVNPRIFKLRPPLDASVRLVPAVWLATFG